MSATRRKADSIPHGCAGPLIATTGLMPLLNSNRNLAHCDAGGGSRPLHQERKCGARNEQVKYGTPQPKRISRRVSTWLLVLTPASLKQRQPPMAASVRVSLCRRSPSVGEDTPRVAARCGAEPVAGTTNSVLVECEFVPRPYSSEEHKPALSAR